MSDNTTLNTGSGGDTIRTLARTSNFPVKTEVVQLDVGGSDSNAESLVSQSNPLPATVTAAGPYGADLAYKLDLIYAELRLQTNLLTQLLGSSIDVDREFRADNSYLDFQ